jgi:hypothetical protein
MKACGTPEPTRITSNRVVLGTTAAADAAAASSATTHATCAILSLRTYRSSLSERAVCLRQFAAVRGRLHRLLWLRVTSQTRAVARRRRGAAGFHLADRSPPRPRQTFLLQLCDFQGHFSQVVVAASFASLLPAVRPNLLPQQLTAAAAEPGPSRAGSSRATE